MPLIFWNRLEKILPQIGKQATGTLLVEPVDLLFTAQEDTAKDQPQHTLGMGFGI